MSEHLPALQVVVPLLGGVLCAMMRNGRLAWGLATLVSLSLPVIAWLLLQQTLATGPISYAMGGWKPPFGIEYRVDVISAIFLLLVSAVGAVLMPYAYRSVKSEISEQNHAWFYCMYLICIAGLLGIAITGDAFNAFVFLEISSLATYTLIAMGRDRRALLAAFRYLVIGTIGATLYVIGVGLIYSMTGTLNFVDIASKMGALGASGSVLAALAFLITGISLKLALFPLHVWLPNAYAYAPSMASVFLAATATKVAVYLLLRIIFSVFGFGTVLNGLPVSEIFIVLSVMAMFGAALVACYQSELKRMLAYSSVSQIGYITLGIALANKTGLAGGITHVVNHGMMKGALFMVMGGVFFRLGATSLSTFAGLGRRMPLAMAAFVIAGMALIGVPGTAGFVSKWLLVAGAMERGWWWLGFLIVASSLIAVVYVGRVVEHIYFREPSKAAAETREMPLSMLLPTLALTLACVWFGFDTRLTAGLAEQAAALLLAGYK